MAGGTAADSLRGDDGSDALDGGLGADTLLGGLGDDVLVGGGGADSLAGEGGSDTADYSASAGALNLTYSAATSTFTNAAADTVNGSDTLAGVETIRGGGGGDAIDATGSAAAHRLEGGAGDDAILAGQGRDTLAGGDGFDTADFGGAGGPVIIDLAAGIEAGTGSVLTSIEAALGGGYGDTIRGDAAGNRLLGGDGADSLAGGSGDDTLSGGAGDDALSGGAGSDTADYSSGRRSDFVLGDTKPFFMGDSVVLIDTRGGGEGADTVTGVEFFAFSDGAVSVAELVGSQPRGPDADPGQRPPAAILGTAGDDRLALESGSAGSVVDGLGGRDWLDLTAEGSRGSSVTVLPDDTVEVARGGRSDMLYDVEEIRFADGRVVFDPSDPAAQVVRLYEAALDRAPEQAGFNYWVEAVQQGYPLSTVAQGFLGSVEFRERFGDETLENGDFVERLYLNILGRAGDEAGREFWVGLLDAGTSRAEVLVGFSESAENKEGTSALVERGIWDRDETAAEVARLYDTVFDRAPDTPGLAYWKGALEAGEIDPLQVAENFMAGGEFQTTYGSLDDRDFVAALYENTLDRPAEAGGLDYWTGRLDAGASRAEIVLAFSESREHVALTADAIQSDDPERFGIAFI